jgi:hypothetical protein
LEELVGGRYSVRERLWQAANVLGKVRASAVSSATASSRSAN